MEKQEEEKDEGGTRSSSHEVEGGKVTKRKTWYKARARKASPGSLAFL